MQNYYDITRIVDTIKNSGLNLNDFTQKEFDEIFKGTQDKKGIVSLKWLRTHGVDEDGYIKPTWYGIPPFAEIISKETFTLDNVERKKLIDEYGREVKNCPIRYFKKLLGAERRKYARCRVVTYKAPLEVARYHYKISFNREAMFKNMELVELFIDDDILRLQKKLDELHQTLEIINRERKGA